MIKEVYMENTTQISLSAITHIGTACTVNDDRIYANGKFMYKHDTDFSRISIEASGKQFLFALSDGMDSEVSGIAVMDDLKKLHEKLKSSSRDIQVKLDELAECVEQSNNLLFSVSLGESDDRLKKPAFAGIIVDDGCIAAVNMGSCRIYKLEGDNFKLMVNDYKRTERLLKMGIISDEQAEMLSGQFKSAGSDGKASVKKSDINALKEGTVYLICSRGLTDSVNEDTMYDMLASGNETDVTADMLVKEALQNEAEDNVTVMVLKVDKVNGEAVIGASPRGIPTRNISGKVNRLSRNVKKRRLDVARLVSTLVLFIVIAAFVFGAITLYLNTRGLNARDVTGNESSGSTTAEAPTTDSGLAGDEGDTAADGTSDAVTDDTTPDDAVSKGEQAADGSSGSTGDAATGTAAGGETTYKVKPGDSLMAISKKFYGDESKYKLIMEANDITNPDRIDVGQVLKIPAAK